MKNLSKFTLSTALATGLVAFFSPVSDSAAATEKMCCTLRYKTVDCTIEATTHKGIRYRRAYFTETGAHEDAQVSYNTGDDLSKVRESCMEKARKDLPKSKTVLCRTAAVGTGVPVSGTSGTWLDPSAWAATPLESRRSPEEVGKDYDDKCDGTLDPVPTGSKTKVNDLILEDMLGLRDNGTTSDSGGFGTAF